MNQLDIPTEPLVDIPIQSIGNNIIRWRGIEGKDSLAYAMVTIDAVPMRDLTEMTIPDIPYCIHEYGKWIHLDKRRPTLILHKVKGVYERWEHDQDPYWDELPSLA